MIGNESGNGINKRYIKLAIKMVLKVKINNNPKQYNTKSRKIVMLLLTTIFLRIGWYLLIKSKLLKIMMVLLYYNLN